MTKRGGPKCGGKLHGRDGTCTLPAGWGTDHRGYGRCRKHLGNAPTVAKAAERERLNHEAAAALAALDVPPVHDPLTELQRLAGQVIAWKNAMAEKVNELADLRYEGDLHGEQLRAEVALWERAMDRCERVLVAMAKLNLDERLVRISEEQARIVTGVILGAFADIGLPQEMSDAIRPAIARRLRLAGEGSPEAYKLGPPRRRVTGVAEAPGR